MSWNILFIVDNNCHIDIDRDISTAYCRPSSGTSVDLLSRSNYLYHHGCWCITNLAHGLTTSNNMQQGVQMDATCNIQQCCVHLHGLYNRREIIQVIPRASKTKHNCPRKDFAQKAKFRGGTLVTRAYIKESTYSWNIQSVCQKKSRFAWTGAPRNL